LAGSLSDGDAAGEFAAGAPESVALAGGSTSGKVQLFSMRENSGSMRAMDAGALFNAME